MKKKKKKNCKLQVNTQQQTCIRIGTFKKMIGPILKYLIIT